MQVKGPVLIMADETDLSNIVARLQEFSADGVKIEKAYLLQPNPHSQANAIAFIVAASLQKFEEFIEIIKGYIGIRTCKGYPSTA